MLKFRVAASLIVLVSIAIGFFAYTTERSDSRFAFKLGLDLAGGVLLTYRADVSDVPEGDVDGAMASLRDVIERRVNLFGVSEPRVTTERSSIVSGVREERLIVELPGVTDVDAAIERIGETPHLEFKLRTKELPDLRTLDANALANLDPDDYYATTELTGRFLKRARIQFTSSATGGLANVPLVELEFDGEGAERFAKITREHVGEVLAIFLDSVPISEPVIQSEITGGTAVITGSFTPTEARELARNLNFGALPVPITLSSTQTIGASLGDEAVASGVRAGIWGVSLVALFMILWYRLPGLVAVAALCVYAVIMIALFKVIPVTLTAAGIAGFIISVGMAVDANILIFERMKEEISGGTKVRDAIESGFKRAWLSIRDANVTSIISAIVLFWFGTSLIEGFAFTLGLGVLVSMISAITVTRTFLLAVAPQGERLRFLMGSGIPKK